MLLNRRLKKVICMMLIYLLIFSAIPVPESNAVFTGLPVIEFIQNVQSLNKADREWIRDNILNPLMSDSTLVPAKAQELKNKFPGVKISKADVETALDIFADCGSVIQNQVVNHLIAGKQTVQYTAGSFDSIKNKIAANVGSLENLVSALVLMQDITGLDPIFTDKNAAEGTMNLTEVISGDMVGGDAILERLDKTIQTITGVKFASLNLVLVGYTELLNSVGTAEERIKFETFLFNCNSSSTKRLYRGLNARESGHENHQPEIPNPPKPPAAEDSSAAEDIITAETNVNADANGNVNMSNDQVNDVLKSIEELSKKADVENSNLETKLLITVEGPKDISETNVNVPSSIINEAVNKNIDMIELATSVAEITIPSSALQAAGAASVEVNAKLVNKETELTPEQKAVVGDSPVYDFNITAVTSSGKTSIRSFAQGLQITVSYTLKPGENAENITVYYLNENGVPENMQGIYDSVSGTVTFTTTHLSKYYVKVNNVVFNDLAKYQWAKTYIESMAAKEIIKGKGENTYCPGDKITRAEFAALLVKLFKIQDSSKSLTFKDVSKKAWYYKAVASAVEQGIIAGKSAGKFAPDESISRQDMAVMIGKVLKKYKKAAASKDAKITFRDNNNISDYAREGIAAAVKYGVIKGNIDNMFKPLNYATRAEAAVVIYKIFNMK